MAKYICSTLPNDNAYGAWGSYNENNNNIPRKKCSVLIKGGSGVANKNLLTPHGVVTKVSDDDFKLLSDEKACPSFSRHVERGFLKVLEKDPYDALRKISETMEVDKSAPLTPEKLSKEGKSVGKTGKFEAK